VCASHAACPKFPPPFWGALPRRGGAVDAITQIKKRGAKSIKFIGIIAAPEGMQRLQEAHSDVDIYVAAMDEKLNENGYIVPGLGDAGDRIFGTK